MEKVNLEKRKKFFKYVNSFFFLVSSFFLFKYSNFNNFLKTPNKPNIKYDKDGYIKEINGMKFNKGEIIK